jgi:hypothetical protein
MLQPRDEEAEPDDEDQEKRHQKQNQQEATFRYFPRELMPGDQQ